MNDPVIAYRPFLNTDPPAIVDLWKQQPRFRRLSSTVSRNDFDRLVFGKPYFDPDGFIVAVDDERPCGFVHAGFGPNDDGSDLGYETGLLLQLRCHERDDASEVRSELTTRALEYLRQNGSTVCFAASRFPWVPYYLGLYGGSRIPGVPHEDESMMQALQQEGFETSDRILVFQLKLTGFRPRVDRNQMTVRRQFQIAAVVDPQPSNWWDNCMYGMAETFAFRLVDRRSKM